MNPFDSPPPPPPHDYDKLSEKNPFDQPALPDHRYDHPRAVPEPPADSRQRYNQRARFKQLRRHSRFHYTNLPWFTMLVTVIQVIVFIVELVKMLQLTGLAFQTKPYFNPMLGPSTYVLINMGARYVPCMNAIESITDDLSISFPCPNSTDSDTNVCSLSQLCGLSGIPVADDAYAPHQWYRIITPIFLHAGFLHIFFNLLLQVTMGSSIEKNIGIIKYCLIYLASGIGGFLLGANFSPNGIASTGASGLLFGIMATNIILFVYCGRKNTNIYGTKHYGLFICIMVGEIVVSLVLGLLPGLDNFSHIGGFAVGVLMAVLLLPDPFFVYEDGIITYNPDDNTMQQFVNNWNPMHNWSDKLSLRVLLWLGARVVSGILLVLYFAMLANNFFGDDIRPNDSDCKWCKYINCIPVHGWCDIGEVSVETTDSEGNIISSSSTLEPTSSVTYLPDTIENTAVKRQEPVFTLLPEIPLGHRVVAAPVGLSVMAVVVTLYFLKRRRPN